jgi:hypothetical protein
MQRQLLELQQQMGTGAAPPNASVQQEAQHHSKQAYMQAMLMQHQMAAMHVAHMHAAHAQNSSPHNLLKFALPRSVARDVGDKELAQVPLMHGKGALDTIQSHSSMGAEAGSLQV